MSQSRPSETRRRRNHLFQVLARAAHRRSLSRRLRLERRPPSSAHGSGVALRRPGRHDTDLSRERAARHPDDEDVSHHRRGADARAEQAGRGRRGAGRRARQLPAQRKGADQVPALRVLRADRRRSSATAARSVPVFNDKHLSWNWEWAREMYDTSRELGFAFMAGSSLPVTWRTPSVEMPLGARISEALCVCYGGVDSYDFHGLETIQCMVERRRGGETGVKWMQAYRGDKFWNALREGVWPQAPDGGRAVPQPHAHARARRLQRHLPDRRRDAPAGEGPGRLPLRARRRPEVHHAPDERPGAGFQLRRVRERRARALLDADVPAHARRPHHAGQFLQPAGEPHRRRCS